MPLPQYCGDVSLLPLAIVVAVDVAVVVAVAVTVRC